MKTFSLEICPFNIEGAVSAQAGGADRIELCDNIMDGGTTPGPGTIKLARKLLEIDIFTMIRPRGGDFCYSENEFEVMKEDIIFAKNSGSDGVVFGILNPDGTIDIERNSILRELAYPMKVTIHRAFDMTEDSFKALEDIINFGADRILTSGREAKAEAGLELLAELVKKAGDRISIMPGAGVSLENTAKILEATGAKEIHLSAKKYYSSKMKYFNKNLTMGNSGVSEFEILDVDSELVRKIKNIYNN